MADMPQKRRRTKGSGSIILRGSIYWIEYQEGGRRLRERRAPATRSRQSAF